MFPLYVRHYRSENGEPPETEVASVQEAEPGDIWHMMFRLLMPEQRQQMTGLFKVKGMKAVFPFLFDDKSPY